MTQFLGHIARGEDISLVDGGAQRRSFTDVDDAIGALMKIIENPNGIATGKIYNIGNPENNFSIRELAEMMLKLAREFPEWAERAGRVKLLDVSAQQYYGSGYQDMLNRRPLITATSRDLGWRPSVGMGETLRGLFRFYGDQLPSARHLIDDAAAGEGASEEEVRLRKKR